ncbi:MAG: GHMP kinase [Methanolinea sp.]|nr:GHMP kinase [Methanolinea sp.]
MTPAATASSPGHLSGYFRPVYGPTPAETGSLGAGIVIREGVTVTVRPARENSVRVERRDPRDGSMRAVFLTSPPVEYLLAELGVRASVETRCVLPIGAGFGLSAAALLATAIAADALFDLSLGPRGRAELAHRVELEFHTGLGDVAACTGGGRDCRRGPGVAAPIDRAHDVIEPLCALVFGPLPSPSVLRSRETMERVAAAYPGRCPRDVLDFFRLSRRFAEESGLVTPEVRHALSACDSAGIPATMTMLGNGIFAYGKTAIDVLSPLGEVFVLHPDDKGARLHGVSR